CAARFLHITYQRGRTVQLILHFGGFAQPGYLAEGKPPLIWDDENTAANNWPAHRRSQNATPWHSAKSQTLGSTEALNKVVHIPEGTVPRVKKKEKEDIIRSKRALSTNLGKTLVSYLPVATFKPSNHDESVVQELARKTGEKY